MQKCYPLPGAFLYPTKLYKSQEFFKTILQLLSTLQQATINVCLWSEKNTDLEINKYAMKFTSAKKKPSCNPEYVLYYLLFGHLLLKEKKFKKEVHFYV